MRPTRRVALVCLALLITLLALLVGVVGYAAYCEGGVRVLFEAETTQVAAKWGETDAQLRRRVEKEGWTLVPGVESCHLGTRFVWLTRYRLAKYLPLGWLGLTPE